MSKERIPTANEFIAMQESRAGVSADEMIVRILVPYSPFGVGGAEALVETDAYDLAIPAERKAFKRAYTAWRAEAMKAR